VSALEQPVTLTVEEQIAQCYVEYTPGQIEWLRWAKWMRRRGLGHEVAR
jgi:hypothetical protein